MNVLHQPLFLALFHTPVPRILLQADTPTFTIVTYNKAYEAATHTENRDVRGKSLWEAYNPDEAGSNGGQILRDALIKSVETNEVVFMPPFAYNIPSANETETVESWWQLEIVPIAGKDGKAEYLLTTTYNITEQIIAGQALEHGLQREQNLVEKLETANEELQATNEDLFASMEALKQSQQKLKYLNATLEEIIDIRTKALTEREAEAQKISEEMLASNEELTLVNEQLEQTIREKSLLENTLRNNEQHLSNAVKELQFLADNVPSVVWTSTPDGNLDFINRRWYDRHSQPIEETLGAAWINSLHPDDTQRVLETWLHSLQTGEPYNIEFRTIDKNGHYRWYLVRALPLKNENGNIIKWYGTNTDIQDQKELETQKDTFLGIVSHELKTPVTSIKAYTQIIENMLRRNGDTKSADLAARMDKQVTRLNNLISDLLDVTKINTGKLSLVNIPFDFNAVVAEVVEDMKHTSARHRMETRLTFEGTVIGDRDRVNQVITNLINNAIKYSPDASRIVIYTENDGDKAMLCVEDFGIGISREKQDHVFEQFYRVSGNKEHVFPGLGLGLFISAEIVRRMNGRIWVNSIEGKGSTFCFTLPNKDAK